MRTQTHLSGICQGEQDQTGTYRHHCTNLPSHSIFLGGIAPLLQMLRRDLSLSHVDLASWGRAISIDRSGALPKASRSSFSSASKNCLESGRNEKTDHLFKKHLFLLRGKRLEVGGRAGSELSLLHPASLQRAPVHPKALAWAAWEENKRIHCSRAEPPLFIAEGSAMTQETSPLSHKSQM